jgi:hypothetical protein
VITDQLRLDPAQQFPGKNQQAPYESTTAHVLLQFEVVKVPLVSSRTHEAPLQRYFMAGILAATFRQFTVPSSLTDWIA